jgi:hypothetical protein
VNKEQIVVLKLNVSENPDKTIDRYSMASLVIDPETDAAKSEYIKSILIDNGMIVLTLDGSTTVNPQNDLDKALAAMISDIAWVYENEIKKEKLLLAKRGEIND